MTNRGITRRKLLKAAAVGAASVAVFPYEKITEAIQQNIPNEVAILAGAVQRVELPKQLHILGQQGITAITVSDTATISRGYSGKVKGLASFVPGEKVATEGYWNGDIFTATALMSIYEFFEGTIVFRQGNRLQTTNGPIQLIASTVPRGTIHTEEQEPKYVAKPLNLLEVGDTIAALIWIDPSSQVAIALKMGVRAKI